MPTGVTYVTEKHSFLVKGTLTYLSLGILGEGAAKGVRKGWYRPGPVLFLLSLKKIAFVMCGHWQGEGKMECNMWPGFKGGRGVFG